MVALTESIVARWILLFQHTAFTALLSVAPLEVLYSFLDLALLHLTLGQVYIGLTIVLI